MIKKVLYGYAVLTVFGIVYHAVCFGFFERWERSGGLLAPLTDTLPEIAVWNGALTFENTPVFFWMIFKKLAISFGVASLISFKSLEMKKLLIGYFITTLFLLNFPEWLIFEWGYYKGWHITGIAWNRLPLVLFKVFIKLAISYSVASLLSFVFHRGQERLRNCSSS